MITVAVPVGPDPGYRKYLGECLASIRDQTTPAHGLLIIDDQNGLTVEVLDALLGGGGRYVKDVAFNSAGYYTCAPPEGWSCPIRVWRTPWLSGVAHAFNFGVALAPTDLVIMLGSDDRLEPWAIEDCLREYRKTGERPGYYWMDVQYSTGQQQRLACNAAMVHKDMWRTSGGFPPESAVGPCDTMLVSILMTHPEAGAMFPVASEKPPYWYRVHDETFSRTRGSKFAAAHGPVRDTLTKLWRPPTWTR